MADDSNELVDANLKPDKSAVGLSGKTNAIDEESDKHRRDLILTHKEAETGSPDNTVTCGEEDTDAELAFLVARNDHQK